MFTKQQKITIGIIVAGVFFLTWNFKSKLIAVSSPSGSSKKIPTREEEPNFSFNGNSESREEESNFNAHGTKIGHELIAPMIAPKSVKKVYLEDI